MSIPEHLTAVFHDLCREHELDPKTATLADITRAVQAGQDSLERQKACMREHQALHAYVKQHMRNRPEVSIGEVLTERAPFDPEAKCWLEALPRMELEFNLFR